MNEILSQNEIDKLLLELDSGDLDVEESLSSTPEKKKTREYDFRRPSKFAKDHLRSLNVIYETFARYATNYLSGTLGAAVHLEVISVEEISYYEFSNSLENPTIMAMVDFNPLNGFIVVEIKSNVAFSIIDKILGGTGSEVSITRNFTDIELSIMERTISQVIDLMTEPWEKIVELRPKVDRIETNPQFAELLSPNEMAALITFDVSIGAVRGLMNICIPHFVLESVMHKLSTKYWFQIKEKEAPGWVKNNIRSQLEGTDVSLKVILGKALINLDEFSELQSGDVIRLDRKMDSDLDVLVGNVVKFKAKPGTKDKRAAIKITDVLNLEEEANE